MANVDGFVDPNSPNSYELTKALKELSGAARSLRLMADFLNEIRETFCSAGPKARRTSQRSGNNAWPTPGCGHPAAGPIVDLVFGSPAIARVGELVERAHTASGHPSLETGESAATSRSPRDPPGPPRLQGLRDGDGGVREVLHVLRGPGHPGPGAQSFAGRHPRGRCGGSSPTACGR